MIDTNALRALLARATPGPYRTSKQEDCHVYHVESASTDTGFGRGEIATCYSREDPNDAQTIVAVMNAIGPLLDELNAARRVVALVRDGATCSREALDDALAAYDAATKGGGT